MLDNRIVRLRKSPTSEELILAYTASDDPDNLLSIYLLSTDNDPIVNVMMN